jgi:hypothetical protein
VFDASFKDADTVGANDVVILYAAGLVLSTLWAGYRPGGGLYRRAAGAGALRHSSARFSRYLQLNVMAPQRRPLVPVVRRLPKPRRQFRNYGRHIGRGRRAARKKAA